MVGAGRTLAGLLLLVGACDLRGAVSQPEGPGVVGQAERPVVARIQVADSSDGVPANVFSLYDVGDLAIEATWTRPSQAPSSMQVLEIYSPDGAVYHAERGAAGEPMRYLLPVAGTSISRHAITGRWWVELRVEGRVSAVAAADFELWPNLPSPE